MNFKQGTKVRVAKNIEITNREYGCTPEMYEMQGTVQEVAYNSGSLVEIYDKQNKKTWMFSKADLKPVKMTKQRKPVTFDPNNLEV